MNPFRKLVAAILALMVAVEPAALIGQAPVSAAAPAAAPSAPQDKGWPRQVTGNGATLVYYQPQIDEWKDYKVVQGRVAFSLTPQGGKPVLGVTSLEHTPPLTTIAAPSTSTTLSTQAFASSRSIPRKAPRWRSCSAPLHPPSSSPFHSIVSSPISITPGYLRPPSR